MRDIIIGKPLASRPVCSGCKSFMRLTRMEPPIVGQPRYHFAYACMFSASSRVRHSIIGHNNH